MQILIDMQIDQKARRSPSCWNTFLSTLEQFRAKSHEIFFRSQLKFSPLQTGTTPSWSRWTPPWAPPSPSPPPPTRTGPPRVTPVPTTTTTTTTSNTPARSTNLPGHKSIIWPWEDYNDGTERRRPRGQFFPDCKIPAVSGPLLQLSGIYNQRLDVCDF